jgi:hypothetical protein
LPRAEWSGGYDKAYEWCRKNQNRASHDALREARQALSACLVRGGGPFVERCDKYAHEAVRQYDRARRNECGFGGSRWSGSYRRHYQWCLSVDPWDSRNEEQFRKDELERCIAQGGKGEEGKMACDHYARLAAEQSASNRKYECGLKGRRWLANYERHKAWCLTTSKVNRDAELKYREDELAKCFERGGGSFDEVCDRYASRSVRQYEKNRKRNCKYRGKYWHGSYIRHYKWCLNASTSRRSRKLLERKLALSTCKIGFSLPFGLGR